jgi:hypothetical protein
MLHDKVQFASGRFWHIHLTPKITDIYSTVIDWQNVTVNPSNISNNELGHCHVAAAPCDSSGAWQIT